MALVFPSFEEINIMKPEPTKGERYLLEFLSNALDDSYEVYFQPLLNGDNPDIIIMRKYSGVLIIEVKDWELEYYRYNDNGDFILSNNDVVIKSPFEQVKFYKDSMYSLHIQSLLHKKIQYKKAYAIVGCAVYFHNETYESVKKFLGNRWHKIIKNYSIMGKDSLNKDELDKILSKNYLNNFSRYFTCDIYKEFKRYLQPPFHKYQDGKNIQYTKRQNKLAESKVGCQKIKGVAGSGKTLILAKRAVNAYKRTDKNVLILTFNITLKNYIHDKISEVREDFSWSNFQINNYHCFILSQLNNLGVSICVPPRTKKEEKTQYLEENYYSNEKLFADLDGKIHKYNAIFIDEVQDYKKEWLDIIKKHFLSYDGEYVLFGDEKQNVYNRELEKDRRPRTNVMGNWNLLNESFRLSSDIANIAMEFQKQYFINKYDIDDIKTVNIQRTIWDINHYVEYLFFNSQNYNFIINKIFHILRELNIHPNDVCFVGTKIDILRNVDYVIRNELRQKTKVVFESEEQYKFLKNENRLNEIYEIRRSRKFNFWMNAGTIKLCTVQSFKGWEVNTLILLIDKEEYVTDELIYTGLTRAMNNLIIVNLGNEKYDEFFKVISDFNIENFVPKK